MQHRYLGDVGDFGKYGLLRALCGKPPETVLKLGVVWYLYPDESHNEDGRHTAYLTRDDIEFRKCDEGLYDGLRLLLLDKFGNFPAQNRHLKHIENSGLLNSSTVYFSEALEYPKSLSSIERRRRRSAWIEGALATTATADLIFLDPDNGIECISVKQTSKKGPKYVFWDDIDAFVQRNQSMVIYHHLNRNSPHRNQVQALLERIQTRYAQNDSFAVTFGRGSSRAYFCIASAQLKDLLRARIANLLDGPWARHFTGVG